MSIKDDIGDTFLSVYLFSILMLQNKVIFRDEKVHYKRELLLIMQFLKISLPFSLIKGIFDLKNLLIFHSSLLSYDKLCRDTLNTRKLMEGVEGAQDEN